MARAIFYMHQISGTCAGMCTFNRTHQMERTDKPYFYNSIIFSYEIWSSFFTTCKLSSQHNVCEFES